MSWGWKITFLYTAFVIMILTLVFLASGEKVELVTPDYYAQELVYQDRIDATHNAQRLEKNTRINLVSQGISIELPPQWNSQTSTGEVKLYRPSDSGMDRLMALTPDTSGVHVIPSDALSPGYYKVQVMWTMDSIQYYTEEGLFVP